MSSITQPTTFSDLYTLLINEVKGDTSQTSTVNQAKRAINMALHDMHLGFAEKLPWAERRAVLRTQPEYTTGTVTITKGSTTLTGSSTAWNTNNDFSVDNVRRGGKMTIGGSKEVYEVQSIASDSSLTLATAFIDSGISGDTYTYFEDEYALASDFLRPLDLQSFDLNHSIRLVSRSEFREMYPRNKTPGKPRVATILDLGFDSTTTPVRKIKFQQPPDDVYLIPYAYITSNLAVQSDGTGAANLSSDDDEPIVPLRYRHAIVYKAAADWFRKKDDTRSVEMKNEYTEIMLRIVGDQEVGSKHPQLRPRISSYRARARRPYRGLSPISRDPTL